MRDDYSISQKTIPSDTMMAALTSCLAKLGKSIPSDGNLGFSISNLFPFYQKDENSEPVFFLPRPLRIKMSDDVDIKNAKKVKKVEWLDLKYFEKVLKGDSLFSNSDIRKIKGEYLTKENIDEKFVITSETQPTPRVTIARNGIDDAVPFYMEKIIFKDYSGLYFIVTGDTSLLDSALDLLSVEGLGTDRNVGNGFFEYENRVKIDNDYKDLKIDIELPENANSIIALSYYIPESKDELSSMISGDNVAYDFRRRGGWVTTHPYNSYRKKYVYAFTPGSIFHSANSSDLLEFGKIVNLKPQGVSIDHPIWRSGKSIFLPIIQ